MRNIKVFLFASPNDAQNVLKITRSCTFFNYFIDKNGILNKRNSPYGSGSRLMYLSDYGISECKNADFQTISRDVARECQIRRFSGIFFDFENSESLYLLQNTAKLLQKPGFTIFIPKTFAGAVSGAKVVLPSAISGGSFSEMLKDASMAYGAENICLDIVCSCQDFTMPSYMPEGKELSPEELTALLDRHGSSVFFSKELCSKYFTYSEGSSYHFVLFDDSSTAIAKLTEAENAGIGYAFILYSDYKDSVADIIGK